MSTKSTSTPLSRPQSSTAGTKKFVKPKPIVIECCDEEMEQDNLHLFKDAGYDPSFPLIAPLNQFYHGREEVVVGDVYLCKVYGLYKTHARNKTGRIPLAFTSEMHEREIAELVMGGDHIVHLVIKGVEKQRTEGNKIVFAAFGNLRIMCIDKIEKAHEKLSQSHAESKAAFAMSPGSKAMAVASAAAAKAYLNGRSIQKKPSNANIASNFVMGSPSPLPRGTKRAREEDDQETVVKMEQSSTNTDIKKEYNSSGGLDLMKNYRAVRYEDCAFTLEDDSFSFTSYNPSLRKDYRQEFLDILESQRRNMYYELLSASKTPDEDIENGVLVQKVNTKFAIFDNEEKKIRAIQRKATAYEALEAEALVLIKKEEFN